MTTFLDPTGLDDRWGPGGSLAGAAAAGYLGIGKFFTYPFRLIPGSAEFWQERDDALQELYDRSNIGGTGWQTTSEVGSHAAGIAITAGLLAPTSAAAPAAGGTTGAGAAAESLTPSAASLRYGGPQGVWLFGRRCEPH